MANYIIIGGDQKKYGPISADDVRQWIAEGRLSEQSLIKVEGAAEFHPLGTFAEFGDAFTSGGVIQKVPPVFNPSENGGRAAALLKVKSPAVALMVVSVLNIVLALWNLLQLIFTTPNLQQLNSELAQLNNPQIEQFTQKLFHLMYGPLGIANVFVELAISVLILAGAKKMKAMQSYQFSMAAASLSLVPCLTPCCGYLLGVAFGIWALVVLRRSDVKSHFS